MSPLHNFILFQKYAIILGSCQPPTTIIEDSYVTAGLSIAVLTITFNSINCSYRAYLDYHFSHRHTEINLWIAGSKYPTPRCEPMFLRLLLQDPILEHQLRSQLVSR